MAKQKQKLYVAPQAQIYTLYRDMLNAGHLLIAGAQGSGKSTVMTGLIHTAVCNYPASAQLVIIDGKRVDYCEYRNMPHIVAYATERDDIISVMNGVIGIMERRYKEMAEQGLKEYEGRQMYIIIDELADLLTDRAYKRQFSPLLQRITQLGRAAHITVIAASQCVLASVIDTSIKCNFASRLALRTATGQDSRNIIGVKGAEMLPNPRTEGHADGIWRNGADVTRWNNLPVYDEAERQRIIHHWTSDECIEKDPEEIEQRPPRRGFFAMLFGRKSA